MNFLFSPVLELFQSSALLRYRARYLGYMFVYTISWDSEIYKLDHHISGSSFTLARCSTLSKVQRQHFIEKTTENIQPSSLWQQLLICLSFVLCLCYFLSLIRAVDIFHPMQKPKSVPLYSALTV